MDSSSIIAVVDDYAARSGLAPSTICQYAVKNAKLYRSLHEGSECLPRTAKRLMAWIDENPPSGGSLACTEQDAPPEAPRQGKEKRHNRTVSP